MVVEPKFRNSQEQNTFDFLRRLTFLNTLYSAWCSGVNIAYFPLFVDCFKAVALVASFASRMVMGVNYSDSGTLNSGKESEDFHQ